MPVWGSLEAHIDNASFHQGAKVVRLELPPSGTDIYPETAGTSSGHLGTSSQRAGQPPGRGESFFWHSYVLREVKNSFQNISEVACGCSGDVPRCPVDVPYFRGHIIGPARLPGRCTMTGWPSKHSNMMSPQAQNKTANVRTEKDPFRGCPGFSPE